MATQKLSTLASSTQRTRLMQLARLLRSCGNRNRVNGASDVSDTSDCKIYSVRDAKNSFSTLLNGASKGDAAFIQGSAGTLLLVDVDVLADVLRVQENTGQLTFGAALKELPYQPSELEPIMLHGHAPQFDHLEKMLRS